MLGRSSISGSPFAWVLEEDPVPSVYTGNYRASRPANSSQGRTVRSGQGRAARSRR